jgi:hypothetical protein
MSGGPYYGKYRGTVVNNVDPLQIGRLLVIVPDVGGLAPSTWCNPCFPVAGMQMGIIAVPVIGSGVYVEFEQGDPDYPVWTGCWIATAAEKPMLAATAPPPIPSITLETPLKNGIVISDGGGPMGVGGIVIKSTSGAMIAINDTGITIMNGKGATITMMGPTIDLNAGALTVT